MMVRHTSEKTKEIRRRLKKGVKEEERVCWVGNVFLNSTISRGGWSTTAVCGERYRRDVRVWTEREPV